MVANALRAEILSGQLGEGDSLPRQEDLLADFRVSPPAVREALRILETEGLIRVRRGNIGGAVVRAPKAQGVAYMVSMVLQHRGTQLEDVSFALHEMEPLCATLCARRSDRAKTVLPAIKASLVAQAASLDDPVVFNAASQDFHEALVASCGNETMVLLVGALEMLWAAHGGYAPKDADYSNSALRNALRTHQKIAAAIEAGNVQSAANQSRRHLEELRDVVLETTNHDQVEADLVRDHVTTGQSRL